MNQLPSVNMPRTITDVDVLQEYLTGVLGRAEHHAPNVENIAIAVAGAVIWRKDPVPLRVFEREGEMKNVLWVQIGGTTYALSYLHDPGVIAVKRDNTHGRELARFDNATPVGDVKAFFGSL